MTESILSMAKKPESKPIICTITGDAGTGKTSLAATFPNPVFIRAEDGMQSIPADQMPDALPVIEKSSDLWQQLKALVNEEHTYKTVVIDSTTKLESLFIKEVVESETGNANTINTVLGGYGAGREAVSAMHLRVRKAASMLQENGINVVFIAHADTETIEPPDDDAYTRYSLRLHKRSISPYVDDVDLVGFIKLESFVMGEKGEKKKVKSDGTRVMTCHACAANVSKNRYGIENDLVVERGVNPLTDYIPSLKPVNQAEGE